MKKRMDTLTFRSSTQINTGEHRNNIGLSKKPYFICVPYIQDFFNNIKRSLSPFNIKVIAQPCNKLKNNIIKKAKDQLEVCCTPNVVYCIKCSNCKASYVEEIKRQLKDRVSEHKRDVKNEEKFSVISYHFTSEKHQMDWAKVSILDKETNYKKRLTSEMVNINLQEKPLNEQDDYKNLYIPYIHLIQRLKPKDML